MVGVAEEWEGEVELLREAGVFFPGVEADAEDDGVLCFVLRDEVPEPGTFDRSAGCVGLRIEPEDDLAAAEIAEAYRIAVLVTAFEVRSLIAGLEHGFRASETLECEAEHACKRH